MLSALHPPAASKQPVAKLLAATTVFRTVQVTSRCRISKEMQNLRTQTHLAINGSAKPSLSQEPEGAEPLLTLTAGQDGCTEADGIGLEASNAQIL